METKSVITTAHELAWRDLKKINKLQLDKSIHPLIDSGKNLKNYATKNKIKADDLQKVINQTVIGLNETLNIGRLSKETINQYETINDKTQYLILIKTENKQNKFVAIFPATINEPIILALLATTQPEAVLASKTLTNQLQEILKTFQTNVAIGFTQHIANPNAKLGISLIDAKDDVFAAALELSISYQDLNFDFKKALNEKTNLIPLLDPEILVVNKQTKTKDNQEEVYKFLIKTI